MVWKVFHPKTFESQKRFMHEPYLRFVRVGVGSRMLRPEIKLVPAVTSLNIDGFVAVFSASRHCIQLKLSRVFCCIFLLNYNAYKSALR